MLPDVKILPHYNYADYEQWEGQWELIEGIPYAMSPLPVPKHQRIAANLVAEFRFQLKKSPDCAAYQPLDYRVADDIVLQPDMLVVCGPIAKKYLDFPPALVAEILSPATMLKDRYTKFPIYESNGIGYFLLISPDMEEVEVYEIGHNGYELKEKGRSFVYNFLIGDYQVNIDFNEIW
ncbi:Uma2 family endonuclease [Foetidibacter luteolus]|uniref:Uma2 family endonuclease n=1 Tax=Foetidibacter luteolus TaxID=2608880 RepID=UPI00129AC48F|nr:Uma2 family endonuclease [Foetidibacter luteolus]